MRPPWATRVRDDLFAEPWDDHQTGARTWARAHPYGSLMHNLHLLRHAKSSWADPTLPDRDRSRREATETQSESPTSRPDRDRARARPLLPRPAHTRDAPATPTRARRLADGEARGGARRCLLAQPARTHPPCPNDRSVMLIGHDPGLHALALVLASAGAELERLDATFPTQPSPR